VRCVHEASRRLQGCELLIERPTRPSPFAFALLAERLSNRLSNETVLLRLQRLIQEAQRVESS
jgi:ATP-dependent Lhr-like helicase